jgi:hypothetical protein
MRRVLGSEKRQTVTQPAAQAKRMFKLDDSAMPEEFRRVLVKLLSAARLEEICRAPERKAQMQERLAKWLPAALDMFGRSNSECSPLYANWGIKSHSDKEMRQKFCHETLPEIEKLGLLGLMASDPLANRRPLASAAGWSWR